MEEVVVGVAVAGGGRIGGPDGADGRGVPTGDGGGGPFGLDRRTGGPQSSSGELLLLASEMSLLSDGQLARLARLLGVRVLALRLRLLSRSEPALHPTAHPQRGRGSKCRAHCTLGRPFASLCHGRGGCRLEASRPERGLFAADTVVGTGFPPVNAQDSVVTKARRRLHMSAQTSQAPLPAQAWW